MTNLELFEAVKWINTRWGGTKQWASWELLYSDFAGFTAGAVMESLSELYRSGLKYAPGPSEVLAAVKKTQARRVQSGEDELDRSCTGRHVWSAPAPLDDRVDSCVLCGQERPARNCSHTYNQHGKCVYCLRAS
jgi:hypothetical protein